jgi:hypothetical protein
MVLSGMILLQNVAERIVGRYLATLPGTEATSGLENASLRARGIDLTYVVQGESRSVKVKPDVYFGTDPAKIADRNLSLYREDVGRCALQAVADSSTRDPGWILTSEADEIFYYYLALLQPEDQIRALVSEPDEVFFSRLEVERDDLLVLPMGAMRAWFAEQAERCPSRPVAQGDLSAWYRLVPRAEIERTVLGATDRGSIFHSLAR